MNLVKALFFVIFAAAPSCALITLHTNIPLFYGYSYEVVNRDSYPLRIAVNGNPCVIMHGNKETSLLQPGNTGTARIRNLSGYGAEVSMSFQAFDPNTEKFVKAMSDTLYVYGNYARAETVIVTPEGLVSRGSLKCRWQ